MEFMDEKADGFKVSTCDNYIYEIFRVSRDTSVEEIGVRITDYLRAELAGNHAKNTEIRKLEPASDGEGE